MEIIIEIIYYIFIPLKAFILDIAISIWGWIFFTCWIFSFSFSCSHTDDDIDIAGEYGRVEHDGVEQCDVVDDDIISGSSSDLLIFS